MSEEGMRQEVVLRPPVEAELPAASALCLRSKALWGYDRDFIESCRDELTLEPKDLVETKVALAFRSDDMIGVAQLSVEVDRAELDKLFVDPEWIGHGIGRILFDWSVETAREHGAGTMLVTADPDAVPFYEKMGFERIGEEPSGSIAGRVLPVFHLRL